MQRRLDPKLATWAMHTHVSMEWHCYAEAVKEGGRPLTGRAMQSNLMKQPKLTYTYECFIAPRVVTASPGAAAIYLYLPAKQAGL